jgi:membrane-bound metal-dependent hydrolase YbcI (DUF457 family)
MFLLAHTGLTLGTALAVQGLALSCNRNKNYKQANLPANDDNIRTARTRLSLSDVTGALARNIDIRFLLFGSLLPDIIDKPLGMLHFGDGRSISHTLLFLMLFLVIGLVLYARKKWKRVLVISGGIFTHLIFDSMWLNTATLFWPFASSRFVSANDSAWIQDWTQSLVHNPNIFLYEIAGFVILAYFAWWLIKQKKIREFIKKGYLR